MTYTTDEINKTVNTNPKDKQALLNSILNIVLQKKVLLLVGFVLILVSCELIPYSEKAVQAYDGSLNWECIQEDAGFSNRIDLAATSFNGALWVSGGYDISQFSKDPYMEDLWTSSDGINWTCVSDNAPWKGRRGHEMLVFNGAMYIMGGFTVDEKTGYREYRNDIWKTTNGTDWEELCDSAEWAPRFQHSIVEADLGDGSFLYLIGGAGMQDNVSGRYAMKYYNDVWKSEDGVTWTEIITSEDFGMRSDAGVAYDNNTGRLIVYGGLHSAGFDDSADGVYNNHPTEFWESVWYTEDGKIWNHQEVDISCFRASEKIVSYDGDLWLMPGRRSEIDDIDYANNSKYYGTCIYEAIDTSAWVWDSEGSGVGARFGYAATVFNNRIWIIGGQTSDEGPDNDIWTAFR